VPPSSQAGKKPYKCLVLASLSEYSLTGTGGKAFTSVAAGDLLDLTKPVTSRCREMPMPPSRPGSRLQRRVARTKAAIEDAFVQLVLERGYDRVAVEDITDRADLARATFYAHYANKQAVQFAVFSRLTEDLVRRLAGQGGPPTAVHRDAISAAYRQAAEMPDLYRACLSDARTRQAHVSALSRYAEQNFGDRLTALGRQPRVPVPVMARAFVGAHVAVLDAWLAGELDGDIEQLASMTLDLLIYGTAWAHGIRLDELGYSTGSPADARTPSPPATPNSRRPLPASTSTSERPGGDVSPPAE
jgi:AcrR family transcriptional regulator